MANDPKMGRPPGGGPPRIDWKDPEQVKAYKAALQRDYKRRHPERVQAGYAARYAAFRASNPLPPKLPPPSKEAMRAKSRLDTDQRRHGGPDEWARMWQEQNGLCYLCLRPLPDSRANIHVDHDHDCCPSGRDTTSCRYCRRGLTHERCNQIWGLAKEDPALLRTMAAEGERVRDETRMRIAAKPHAQGELFA